MPLSTRQQTRRKLEQTIGNIDWAVYHLSDIGETYADQHPEITQPLAEIVAILEEVKKLIDKVHRAV